MWPSLLSGAWGVAQKQEVGQGAWCSFIVSRDNAMTLSVLIPTILAVLLLLLVAASLLTLRIMKQQKKGDQIWLTCTEAGLGGSMGLLAGSVSAFSW